jgi:hypothetical protein
MSEVEFTQRLEAALSAPMTARQRVFVDSRVAAIVAGQRERATGWRRMTTRTAVLIALLVVVVLPTVFVVSAEFFGTESPFGLANTSEFNREIEAAKALTPIPARFSWPASLRAQEGTAYSRGGGRAQVEYVAICMWQVDWLDARNVQDHARQMADGLVIAGIPTWSSYGPPFADQSYRDVLDRVIGAVDRDDAAPVAANVALNCAGIRR